MTVWGLFIKTSSGLEHISNATNARPKQVGLWILICACSAAYTRFNHLPKITLHTLDFSKQSILDIAGPQNFCCRTVIHLHSNREIENDLINKFPGESKHVSTLKYLWTYVRIKFKSLLFEAPAYMSNCCTSATSNALGTNQDLEIPQPQDVLTQYVKLP